MDHLPSRPIRSFGRNFRRTIFCLVQSDSSGGLQTDHLPSRPIRSFGRTSYGPSSVSSNQILRTDFRRTIFRLVQSDPLDGLQTDHLPSRPIKSFGVSSAETPKRFKSFEWSRTTRVTRARSPSLSTTRHSNNLRSHERDGWNRRKKSPRAKAVRSSTH